MINRVVLVGRLTRDPELKYTTNNIANLRFTVAVNRQFTNQNGERQADFINCVAWRAQAENMARFLKKGSLIGVEGRIETGSFQGQDGQTRYTTDVIADSVQFLEPRNAQSGGGAPQFGGNNNDFNQFQSNDFNQFQNNSGGQQGGQFNNSFPSAGSSSMNNNSFPTNNNTNNNVPDFNSTIDISDDDLPF